MGNSVAPVREVASGIGLTEGPIWTLNNTIAVCSMSRGLIYEIEPGRAARPIGEAGGSPNGLAQAPDGTMWVAQNGGIHVETRSLRPVTASLQQVRDGVVEDMITEGLDAPNDCVFGPDRRLWFTDPRGSASPEQAVPGRLLALDINTLELEVLTDGPLYPNGLAFGPDPDDFYLAESGTGRILHARRTALGLGPFTPWAQLPDGAPDGLAVDCAGNVYAAGVEADAVFVFDPGGCLRERIDVRCDDQRTMATNVCFGGPDGSTLFVTVLRGGRVLAVEREVPGAPVTFAQVAAAGSAES